MNAGMRLAAACAAALLVSGLVGTPAGTPGARDGAVPVDAPAGEPGGQAPAGPLMRGIERQTGTVKSDEAWPEETDAQQA